MHLIRYRLSFLIAKAYTIFLIWIFSRILLTSVIDKCKFYSRGNYILWPLYFEINEIGQFNLRVHWMKYFCPSRYTDLNCDGCNNFVIFSPNWWYPNNPTIWDRKRFEHYQPNLTHVFTLVRRGRIFFALLITETNRVTKNGGKRNWSQRKIVDDKLAHEKLESKERLYDGGWSKVVWVEQGRWRDGRTWKIADGKLARLNCCHLFPREVILGVGGDGLVWFLLVWLGGNGGASILELEILLSWIHRIITNTIILDCLLKYQSVIIVIKLHKTIL